MSDVVNVRVVDPSGRTVIETRATLPFTLGRGKDAVIRFGDQDHFPDRDTLISRLHASVTREGDEIVVQDRSANGSSHHGHDFKGGAVTLADEDEVTIQGYRIALQRIVKPKIPQPQPKLAPAPPEPLVLEAVVQGSRERRYSVGPNAIVIVLGPQKRILEVPPQDPAALLAQHPDSVAVIAAMHGVASIIVAGGSDGRVLLNLSPLGPGPRVLASLDLVQAGSLRIAMVKPGESALECVNAACRRLNPYRFDLNCRWCGFALNEARTRVVGH